MPAMFFRRQSRHRVQDCDRVQQFRGRVDFMRQQTITVLGTLLLLCWSGNGSNADEPVANQQIRGAYGGSEIVITTTRRLAGAIDSLKWNGVEFIDSHDHGRQLQSACSFDASAGGQFVAECFNPTEAGCRNDRDGDTSTSRLLRMQAQGAALDSTVQMAFWLAPGQQSGGRDAINRSRLSEHRVRKQIHIGYRQFPNVIDYRVTFSVPDTERHTYAQFEALTGYMPSQFSRFETIHPDDGVLQAIDDGPGEQSLPLIFSTEDGAHAMGIWSPDQPSSGYRHAGYGRFRFAAAGVVKWNCVFRVRNPDGVRSGDYSFQQFVIVGDRAAVRDTMTALAADVQKTPAE